MKRESAARVGRVDGWRARDDVVKLRFPNELLVWVMGSLVTHNSSSLEKRSFTHGRLVIYSRLLPKETTKPKVSSGRHLVEKLVQV